MLKLTQLAPDGTSGLSSQRPVFWHSAYFIASCGGVTVETLKHYVQQQSEPPENE
jgi:putative transposase